MRFCGCRGRSTLCTFFVFYKTVTSQTDVYDIHGLSTSSLLRVFWQVQSEFVVYLKGVQICRLYIVIDERKSSNSTPSSYVDCLNRRSLFDTNWCARPTQTSIPAHFRSPNTHVSPPRRPPALASVIVFNILSDSLGSVRPSHCSYYDAIASFMAAAVKHRFIVSVILLRSGEISRT